MNRRLAPAVTGLCRARRLRRLIAGTVLVSSIAGIGMIYLAKRMRDRPFEEAADRRAKMTEARYVVKRYALEAFPAWVVEHPDTACPRLLAELNPYAGRGDTVDPWGLPYQHFCPTSTTFRVMSAGPDRIHGTYDDIVEGK